MRRTDRLFELIQILRDGKLHRASDLAARVKVSTRTIFLHEGRVEEDGPPEQVLVVPKSERCGQFIAAHY